MSDESEDSTELRDLLFRALEMNGVISNVRAQLRSSVYTIIDQERRKTLPVNDGLTHQQFCIVDPTVGPPNRISLALIRDFLKRLKLYYTLNLLDNELSLDEIDLEYNHDNGRVFMPDFDLPETISSDQVLKPFDILPIDISPEDSNEKGETNSNSSRSTTGKSIDRSNSRMKVGNNNNISNCTTKTRSKKILDISQMPVLSKIIFTKCISRHSSNIKKEFKEFNQSFNMQNTTTCISQSIREGHNLTPVSQSDRHEHSSPNIAHPKPASSAASSLSQCLDVHCDNTHNGHHNRNDMNSSVHYSTSHLHQNNDRRHEFSNVQSSSTTTQALQQKFIHSYDTIQSLVAHFKNFPATRKMPKLVIEAYIKEVLSDDIGDISYHEVAVKVLSLITTISQEVLSSEKFFTNPPVIDKRLQSSLYCTQPKKENYSSSENNFTETVSLKRTN